MKKLFFVVGLAVMMAVGAFAQIFDFTLVNNTGYDIYSVYVSPSDDDEWGEDVLSTDILYNGYEFDITFDADYEALLLAYGIDLYDLQCKYSDGSTDEWFNLKLEQILKITVTLDKKGNGIATWE